MEKEKLNIYQKMLLATEKIGMVAKKLNVPKGKDKNGNITTYKAVNEVDILEAVKPIEIELGIYSFPYTREITETNIITSTSSYNGNTKETNNLFMRLETGYRFVNVDNPTEYIDMVSYGDGVDSQDKAPGKAMTYADKYALMKAYKIQTGDDPDQEPSAELKGKQTTYEKPTLTDKQRAMIELLYTPEEIIKMSNGLKRNIDEWTIEEASKAIAKRKEKNNE